MQIPGLKGLGPGTVAKRAVKDFFEDHMTTYAAALAYHVLFAIFPFIVFLVALLGVLLYGVLALRDVASTTLMPKVGQTLDQVKDSASAAKGTTAYVAETVVSPIIKLTSLATGVRVAAAALARRDKPRGYEPD
jgi:membrane protein